MRAASVMYGRVEAGFRCRSTSVTTSRGAFPWKSSTARPRRKLWAPSPATSTPTAVRALAVRARKTWLSTPAIRSDEPSRRACCHCPYRGKQWTGRPSAYSGWARSRISAGKAQSSLSPWPMWRAGSCARKRVASRMRVAGSKARSRDRPSRTLSRSAKAPELGSAGAGSTAGWPVSRVSVFEPKMVSAMRSGSTTASPIWLSTISS